MSENFVTTIKNCKINHTYTFSKTIQKVRSTKHDNKVYII
jgi:hypothetical protein